MDFSVLLDYWALTKPEINLLITITTFAGFYLGTTEPNLPLFRMIHTLLGTLLVASGAGSLNQYLEQQFDAQMRRTSRRPLASGRLKPRSVLWFGVGLSVTGTVYLALAVNALASGLALFTLLSYLFCYTPLKRKSPLCMVVGAIPGATPPLIGWAAGAGTLNLEAWTLFAVLFLWQFPHFMAIAWMYREDYDRAGYLVLPRGRARTAVAILQTLLPLLLLVAVCAVGGYPIWGLMLSLGYFYYGIQFARTRTISSARRLLASSILFLPLFFVVRILVR